MRWRDGGYRSSYGSRSRYRYADYGHSSYGPRYYYTRSFFRPQFVYRSGFSIGLVIGAVPAYGYHYYDPYCDSGFYELETYYGHCHSHRHPSVILVVDADSQYPIASCTYDDGYWTVDDCY